MKSLKKKKSGGLSTFAGHLRFTSENDERSGPMLRRARTTNYSSLPPQKKKIKGGPNVKGEDRG